MARPTHGHWRTTGHWRRRQVGLVGFDPASSQKQAWTLNRRIEKKKPESHGFETNLPLKSLEPILGSRVGRVKSVD